MYIKICHMLCLCSILILNLTVERHHDSGIHMELVELLRQSTDDIGKAAQLHKGSTFRCNHQYVHHTLIPFIH